jgi:hypothetical protein
VKVNWVVVSDLIKRFIQVAVVAYILIMANAALYYQRQSLELQLAYDKAALQLMNDKNDDGPDPNPPDHEDRL